MMKEEMTDFREDWMAMRNNMYLLEDGDAGTLPVPSSQRSMQSADAGSVPQKPKKRKGKSTLFKIVAKPASILASFRRKRKEKKKQKKQPLMPFPSTV